MMDKIIMLFNIGGAEKKKTENISEADVYTILISAKNRRDVKSRESAKCIYTEEVKERPSRKHTYVYIGRA